MSEFPYTESISKALDIECTEAKIIQTILYSKSLTVTEISLLTKINRSSCYKYIYNLRKKGLVNVFNKNNKTTVELKDINRIFSKYRDINDRNYRDRCSKLNHIESIFKLKFNSNELRSIFEKPTIEIYEGEDSLINIYKKSLDSKFMLAYFDPWADSSNKTIDEWHANQREQKSISLKLILPNNERSQNFAKVNLNFRDILIIESFNFQGMKLITDKYILDYSDKDKIGFCIKSEYLAKNEAEKFLFLWRHYTNKNPN